MAKAIFTTKVNPTYDDLPEERYHFPRTYLNTVRETVGDFILYYEPRRTTGKDSSRGGRLVYFATARVDRIIEDPQKTDHYYALVTDYLEFPGPVPFREDSYFWENALKKKDGSVNKGLFGRAVRLISDAEYTLILQRGCGTDLFATAEAHVSSTLPMVAEPPADYGRKIVQRIVNQSLRDAAFTTVVRQAYDSTCAMTGIRLINGGGRCEIEAAHIRPVSEHGPDSPRNGIALSRTCHWMFDRGILSIEDNGKILTAGSLVPEAVQRMLNPEGTVLMPENQIWQPHRQFLYWHRENVFKG
jgi:putative restriction endonuclease